MLGIALDVAALIIVLSVMNGFQKEVRDRMLSVVSHVEVTDFDANALPDWRATAEIARNVGQTSASVQEMTGGIGGVSQGANDTGAAAGEVLAAASDLSRQAKQLTAEVGDFVGGIRAA